MTGDMFTVYLFSFSSTLTREHFGFSQFVFKMVSSSTGYLSEDKGFKMWELTKIFFVYCYFQNQFAQDFDFEADN